MTTQTSSHAVWLFGLPTERSQRPAGSTAPSWARPPTSHPLLASAGGPPTDVPPPNLTDRERAVLELVAGGLTATAIARRLGVTSSTVRKHLEHAYAKLGHHDRHAAATQAQRLGLI